jgi:release factor glutamine methyltransferase
MEIGWDQADTVLEIFLNEGFVDGVCHKDLAGKDRVIALMAAKKS